MESIRTPNCLKVLKKASQKLTHRRSASDSVAFSKILSWIKPNKPHYVDDNNYSLEEKMGLPNYKDHMTLPIKSEINIQLKNGIKREIRQDIDTNDTKDVKKLKRMRANRAAAQRSRIRKMQQIEDLRKAVETGMAQMSSMRAHVQVENNNRAKLEKENEILSKQIRYSMAIDAFKAAQYETLKKEKEMLQLTLKLKQEGYFQ